MEKKTIFIAGVLATILAFTLFTTFLVFGAMAKNKPQQSAAGYNPQINPADFVAHITNPYLTYIPGTKFIYEGNVEEGRERTEVYVTNEKRTVMGIPTTVVWDRVWLNGELIEDTKDWYAQDKDGNVWYFGEESYELIDGQIVNNAGSWEAGVDGAQPGIVMLANPQVGQEYRQEYYAGEAEDMGKIIALVVSVKGPSGSYSNCLQTMDINPLEPGDEEYKYYCPTIGNLVYEVSIEDGEGQELISVEKNAQPSPSATQATQKSASRTSTPSKTIQEQAEITEQQARDIALQRVPGRITDVAIEKKFNKPTWVVEIDADNGPETDVIIDMQTGKVLGIET
jgi:uncharacterized membrane protein YkoI